MDELRGEFAERRVGDVAYVDLRGFPFHELMTVTWDHVDLSGATFLSSARRGQVLGPRLVGTGSFGSIASRFTHCRFVAVDATDANVEGSYEDCDFSGSRLATMHFFVGTSMVRCSFRGANMRRSKAIADVRFVGCDFTGASLKGCRLEGTVFKDCLMRDTVLDGGGLVGVRFERCAWENVSLDGIVAGENVLIDTSVSDETRALLASS